MNGEPYITTTDGITGFIDTSLSGILLTQPYKRPETQFGGDIFELTQTTINNKLMQQQAENIASDNVAKSDIIQNKVLPSNMNANIDPNNNTVSKLLAEDKSVYNLDRTEISANNLFPKVLLPQVEQNLPTNMATENFTNTTKSCECNHLYIIFIIISVILVLLHCFKKD